MKYLLTVLALSLGINMALAQEVYNSSGKPGHRKPKETHVKGFDPNKLVFGGGASLSFGDVTDIGLSPMIGYRFTENFTAGIGIGYEYLNIKDYWDLYDPNTATDNFYPLKSSVFYPSIWTRYFVYKNVFVQGQFEYDIIKATEYSYDANYLNVVSSNFNVNVPCLLFGAGAKFPVSGNVSFVATAMYDVLQKDYSPYKNRIDVRFGIFVGF